MPVFLGKQRPGCEVEACPDGQGEDCSTKERSLEYSRATDGGGLLEGTSLSPFLTQANSNGLEARDESLIRFRHMFGKLKVSGSKSHL